MRIPKRYMKISHKFMEEYYYLSLSTNNKCCSLHFSRSNIIIQTGLIKRKSKALFVHFHSR